MADGTVVNGHRESQDAPTEAANASEPTNGVQVTNEEDDDELIRQILDGSGQGKNVLEGLDKLEPTERADDAVNYSDISDDDLPDEEEGDVPMNGASDELADLVGAEVDAEGQEIDFDELFGGPDEGGDVDVGDQSLDDLFGDGEDLPLIDSAITITLPNGIKEEISLDTQTQPITDTQEISLDGPNVGEASEPEEEDEEWREQMRLFGLIKDDAEILPDPENEKEIFERIWPTYGQDDTPRWNKIMTIKKARYNGKKPIKPPKVLQPTKLNLVIEPDQERQFKLAVPLPTKRKWDEVNENGIVYIEAPVQNVLEQVEEDSDGSQIDEDERVGGVTFGDLRVLCADWDDYDVKPLLNGVTIVDGPEMEVSKRLKVSGNHYLPIINDDFPSFDNFEAITAKLAKRAVIDLNDPGLLIDTNPQLPAQTFTRISSADMANGGAGKVKKALEAKYNFSNDDAYELLKENHSNKIRSTLANINIEHSLPAAKLQFPFYKRELNAKEARSYHRPNFQFPNGTIVKFSQTGRIKTKALKGLDVQEIFKTSRDLSMADNSQMLLVEYSEEYPMVLSDFGMGNKLINYYRRKDDNDHNRPKAELGDTQVLLPQDKSPFSIFGNIDPGQVVPTFHNGMYRTPVFIHPPKNTDFLCIRSMTVRDDHRWYLRNMENLHIAGQQLPSKEIPAPHSRKVTDTAKRRLHMIAYRIYQKNLARGIRSGQYLSNDMIRPHLPGTDLGQTRQKMREFMDYDKNTMSWNPKAGHPVPDEEVLRSWIRPEDVCLLDAKQVGERHLADIGYNEAQGEDDSDEDGQGIDKQMAPWELTKNFIFASQGKAMLKLHGEGDPSGRGEAFSFIKTSMKGGFQAIGESISDRLDAKKLKELGGHAYNVNRQQEAYNEALARIWDAQWASLTSNVEHDDVEPDIDADDEAEQPQRLARTVPGRTPKSEIGTPSVAHHLLKRDDETGSQFSKLSANSGAVGGKSLRIVRTFKNGKRKEEVITNPKVIKSYLRQRKVKDEQNISIDQLLPTGNAEEDAQARKRFVPCNCYETNTNMIQTRKGARTSRKEQRAPNGSRQGQRQGIRSRNSWLAWQPDTAWSWKSSRHSTKVCWMWSNWSHQDQQEALSSS
jgi:hypothetical protein